MVLAAAMGVMSAAGQLQEIQIQPDLFDGLDAKVQKKVDVGRVRAPSIKVPGHAGKGVAYHELMLEDIQLAVGETVAVDFVVEYTSADPNDSNRGAEGGGGIMVGDRMVLLENTKKDLRVLVRDRTGKTDASKLPYYAVWGNVDEGRFTLQVHRTADKLQWLVKGGKVNCRASLQFKPMKSKVRLGLAISPAPKKGKAYSLTNLRKGRAELADAPPAPLHPLIVHKPRHDYKYDWDFPPAKNLVLDSVQGALTAREIQGVENYLLEYIMPENGWMNYYFRRRYVAYMYEWAFEKTGNVRLVEKAVDFANTALDSRNDRYGEYELSYGGVGPIWPNYKEVQFRDDGTMELVPGAGAFGGLACMTVPVRLIANHPEIWEKTYNAKTFRQIADELAEASWETIDYCNSVFRGEDNVLRYPDYLMRKEWRGEVLIYNRVFPLLTGAIPLAEAYEKLGLHPERVETIDAVNGAMIDYWQSTVTRRQEEDGKTYINYPYSAMRLAYDPDSSEDVGHGSFDSRDFQLFYQSGRYNFTETDARGMADTIADVVSLGDGTFTARLIGDPKKVEKNYTYLSGLEGYIWYARYRPKLYGEVVQYILDTILAGKNPDSRVYWEIYKLKEPLKKER